MSFSFGVKAGTKEEALARVAEEMKKVVASQPIHAKDEANVNSAAKAQADLLAPQVEGELVAISMAGSLSWTGGTTDPERIVGASVNAYAHYTRD